MDFYVECLQDGRLRVFYDDGTSEAPPALPSVAKAHGKPIWPAVRAAVEAAPSAMSDGHGLYWQTRGEAKRACAAARRAWKAEGK